VFGQGENDEDDEDDDDEPDSHASKSKKLIDFFKSNKKNPKKKKPAGVAEKNKQQSNSSANSSPKKPKSTIDFPFKVYVERLNPVALKKYDKPECWEAHTENSAFEALNSLAVEYSVAKIDAADATEVDFNRGAKIVLECTAAANSAKPVVLYPQLRTSDKTDRRKAIGGEVAAGASSKDSVWFNEFQMWKFNKSGFIYNQFFPKLCLTLNTCIEVKLEIRLRPQAQQTKGASGGSRLTNRRMSDGSYQDKTEVIIRTGYAVVMGTRQLNEANNYTDKDQQWNFNKVKDIFKNFIKFLILLKI
jgi:hypothetical protein